MQGNICLMIISNLCISSINIFINTLILAIALVLLPFQEDKLILAIALILLFFSRKFLD